MLAAMSSPAPRSSSQATAVARDRGDACPGSLRLHAADDGALARIRIPGGVLDVRQADALSAAARDLGDGELHLTSRGNVQLRGLRDDCGAQLATILDSVGLLPSHTHERVRNVVASPLSGLDGAGFADVRPWLTGLDAALCVSETARALSGRFLFALDDGRGDVAGLDADVTVRAAADGAALLSLGSSAEAVAVPGADAPRSALIAAETFLTSAAERTETGRQVWRVAELGVPAEELTRTVAERLAAAGVDCAIRVRELAVTEGPLPGVSGDALSVHIPLGRLSARQWDELTRTAERHGGELRLTPWRGAVVPTPGPDPSEAAYALARLAAAGLVTSPDSPWLRVGACIGRPGCAKSHADVRADAARALDAAAGAPLPLYWSGCERRCGHPRTERIDVVAAPEGGYRLTATTATDVTDPPSPVLLDDPSHLATALVALTDRTA
ncbi:precorrin-3B synthase [Streptomyces cavernicola]|uniref:Precorrin-3B synthase n=1 Tax=Streptomyces cavernicola TaxID=3043613 RepID=A0ABT6SMA0_9ACTN|nr:precorrin-3B synthase [Streptomyces sp. B-S-A6]MDI3409322.1 precorrin-3B synthase [Streptomyces sp. B-S-A6]